MHLSLSFSSRFTIFRVGGLRKDRAHRFLQRYFNCVVRSAENNDVDATRMIVRLIKDFVIKQVHSVSTLPWCRYSCLRLTMLDLRRLSAENYASR